MLDLAVPQLGAAAVALAPGLVTTPFHFFTTGYGGSVAAIAALNIFKAGGGIAAGKNLGAVVQNCIMGFFGIRLAAFLAIRSTTDSYKGRKEITEKKGSMSAMPISGRATMLASLTLFYTMLCFPAGAALSSGVGFDNKLFAAGVSMMGMGAALETVADHHKQAVKNKDANKFVSTGVFRICRHPAYFAEVLFWTGNYAAGCASMGIDWKSQLISGVGLAGIWGVMLGASKRLATKQDEKYGKDKEWQAYKQQVKGTILPKF